MKKSLGIISAVVTLLFFGAIFATAAEARMGRNEQNQNPQNSNGYGDGELLRKMIRLRNQIRDMLGVCQGGCNLEELTGVLNYDQNVKIFTVDDSEVHFGPYWYIIKTESPSDFDNDGTVEFIFDELQGLVGSVVTLKGHYQSDDWLSVFYINGVLYREPGKPIWSNGNHGPD